MTKRQAFMLATLTNPTVAAAAVAGITRTPTKLIAARKLLALPFRRAASTTASTNTPGTWRDVHTAAPAGRERFPPAGARSPRDRFDLIEEFSPWRGASLSRAKATQARAEWLRVCPARPRRTLCVGSQVSNSGYVVLPKR